MVDFTPAASLASSTAGKPLRVVEVQSDGADIQRLQALGVCVGRKIELVQAGNPAIVRLVGARVGISAQLARSIMVQSEAAQAEPAEETTPSGRDTQNLPVVA